MFGGRNALSCAASLSIAAAALLFSGFLAVCSGEQSNQSRQEWLPQPASLLKRTEVAAARVGTSIYLVGGFIEVSGSGKTTAAVERYDLGSRQWSRVRSMPVGLNHPAAVAYRGKLYVVGGYKAANGLSDESNRLLRYSPEENSWQSLKSMPTTRAALAAVVIGSALYAVGGTNVGKDLATLDVYNFRTDRWHREKSMETARNHIAAAAVGRFLYVVGGRSATAANLRTVERYDSKEKKWHTVAALKKERSGIAAVAVGSKIVVFGGEESSGTIKEVEQLDSRKGRWSRLSDMRTPRHGLGGAIYDRRIYALEGGPQPGFAFSNRVEVLDIN